MSINDALQIILALFTTETFIGIIATLVGGWLVKRVKSVDNRLIPALTFLAAVITQVINFVIGQPPPPEPIPGAPDSSLGMALEAGYMQAGFFSGFPLKALAAAIIQWVFVDKLYTTQKKVVVGIQEVRDGVSIKKTQVEK